LPSKIFNGSIALYGSLIGIPDKVTVDVVEAARWMGIFSLTFEVGMDLDGGLLGIGLDEMSGVSFPEGK
jgi:hypothetical protein